MDGGFFLCPDAWEFLLPAGVRHLRDAGAVCRKRWDLLTLTPMGCGAAAGACGGDSGDLAAAGGLPQKRSPGGNSGDLRPVPTGQHHPVQPAEPCCASSGRMPLLCGGVLEPQEFPLPGVEGAERLLPGVGTRLLWTGSPYPL